MASNKAKMLVSERTQEEKYCEETNDESTSATTTQFKSGAPRSHGRRSTQLLAGVSCTEPLECVPCSNTNEAVDDLFVAATEKLTQAVPEFKANVEAAMYNPQNACKQSLARRSRDDIEFAAEKLISTVPKAPRKAAEMLDDARAELQKTQNDLNKNIELLCHGQEVIPLLVSSRTAIEETLENLDRRAKELRATPKTDVKTPKCEIKESKCGGVKKPKSEVTESKCEVTKPHPQCAIKKPKCEVKEPKCEVIKPQPGGKPKCDIVEYQSKSDVPKQKSKCEILELPNCKIAKERPNCMSELSIPDCNLTECNNDCFCSSETVEKMRKALCTTMEEGNQVSKSNLCQRDAGATESTTHNSARGTRTSGFGKCVDCDCPGAALLRGALTEKVAASPS